MKILFIGTVDFSYKSLEKIIELDFDIVGVCTKQKSLFNSDFKDLTPLCERNDIPVRYIDDINSKDNIEWIIKCKADIIFCFGWSSLIKKELLELTPMGIVGFHPTKLPQNRGRHPIIWALTLGLTQSASTFFFMDEGADTGDILSQINFNITHNDNARTLYNKITDIALKQIEEFLPLLKNNIFKRVKQDHQKANNWRKRTKKDGEIDFRMSSKAIYNLVRALTKPYVGSHLVYNDMDIKIWSVKIVKNNLDNIESGKVLKSNNKSILVKTYDEAIEIIEHEFKTLPKVGEYL